MPLECYVVLTTNCIYTFQAVQEDDEELRVHIHVKIRPDVTESAAHANVLVGARVLHALAIVGDLNLAALRDASLVVMDADVECSK